VKIFHISFDISHLSSVVGMGLQSVIKVILPAGFGSQMTGKTTSGRIPITKMTNEKYEKCQMRYGK
jgi:hypothetical protein